MNPVTLKAAIIAVAVGVTAALVVGFGAGWTVNGWRLSGSINKLQGITETQKQGMDELAGANRNCIAGVGGIKDAVREIADDSKARSDAAAKAMAAAAKDAQVHLAAAKDALNRPPAAKGKECEAIAAEASAYAKKRKAAK